jgi:hypothetical protein
MKKLMLLFLCVLIFVPSLLPGKLLSEVGSVDLEAISILKGFWVMEDSTYVFEFTDRFATFVYGLKYFHYKRSPSGTSDPWIYTVVKSKKSGQWYFARGNYRNSRFYGSTSELVIDDPDHITVYSSKYPNKVYFKAKRIKKGDRKTGKKHNN